MKHRLLFAAAVVFSLALAGILKTSFAEDADDAPEYTTKDVMKTCMKEGLCKKVVEGGGSAEEKAKLLEMLKALPGNKPPKGDADSWAAKTKALVDAAQAVVDGTAGAEGKLKAAADCAACHGAHKPK